MNSRHGWDCKRESALLLLACPKIHDPAFFGILAEGFRETVPATVRARFWDQSWNASVIWCKQSTNPPVAHQRRCCETLKGRWHELDTGHYPMLSEPEALAKLIVSG